MGWSEAGVEGRGQRRRGDRGPGYKTEVLRWDMPRGVTSSLCFS